MNPHSDLPWWWEGARFYHHAHRMVSVEWRTPSKRGGGNRWSRRHDWVFHTLGIR